VPLHLAAGALKGAIPPRLRYVWRLVRDRHWQIAAPPSESRDATDQVEGNRGACPAGMIEVSGLMKLDPSPNAQYDLHSIEEMQKATCKHWINKDYPERCAEFDREKWLALSKDLATKPMRFCIDRYEYPNQKGAYPIIMVSWYEAGELCAEDGKRLCTEAEWTFACEGEEASPYPYGYVRDPDACVVDQQWHPFKETAMQPRNGSAAMAEMDRLWQGVQSGSRPRCRSPFGVYDMTGNVDEWTRSVREGERPSILKGGYWGPVRTRCRPSTRSHDENHTFYQQGLRCCSDFGAAPVDRTGSNDPASAPLPRELR
jgi:formylglycine-generating enzyme